MKLRLVVLAVTLAISALASAAVPAVAPVASVALVPTPDEVDAARITSAFLSRFHYHPVKFDVAFSRTVFDRLLKGLDPGRSTFTQADTAQWSSLRDSLAAGLAAGDVEPAFAPVNRYLERSRENVRYAQSLLALGFDLTARESLDLDRKGASWPASDDELHELWRKRAKDDWLRLKLAGQSDASIRAMLGKRYSAMLNRLQKTSASDAFELVMTALAESADPHTDYFVPRVAERFNTEMSLSLVGIGAYLREHDEYTQVTELVPGGPASDSGLIHPGDRITGVGQGSSGAVVDVVGWRSDDVVALIRGSVGTKVRLDVMPDGVSGDAKLRHVVMVRRKVTMEDQAASQVVMDAADNGHIRRIGVITVPSFYEDFDAHRAGDPNYRSLTRDVSGMLDAFKKQRVDGVLLDLRDNGGGSLSEASGLAGLFMGGGPVVQVRNAHGEIDVQTASDTAPTWSGPVGVLVNHGSASASEIFAAAIQDRGRGVIIGERTFGKGTVQNVVNLNTFSSDPKGPLGELKMTIAEFFRVNGASTQMLGVTPDVAFPDQGNEALFGESSYDNALPNSRIAAVAAARGNTAASGISALGRRHISRVALSPRWALMLDELEGFQRSLAMKTESLNLEERQASRKSELDEANAFRERRRAIDRQEGIAVEEDATGTEGDDGLTAAERTLPARKHAGRAEPSHDPQVQEAAQIVGDESKVDDMLAHSPLGDVMPAAAHDV